MPAVISLERPDTPDAEALITELDAQLEQLYPAMSRHGYSVDKLLTEGVAFFVIRDGSAVVGCGGVQLFDDGYGEIKRMYVRPAYRGRGYAKLMLDHLTEYTRRQGAPLLRLETGIHQHAAIALYERAGFKSIPPFGEYTDDPLSRYYERRIE